MLVKMQEEKIFVNKLVKLWHVSYGHCLYTNPIKINDLDLTLCYSISDMKSNNYEVVDAGETIKFRGIVERSASQAFFLTFCTAIGFASLALVLQIQFQGLGKNIKIVFFQKTN